MERDDKTPFEQHIEDELQEVPSGWSHHHEQSVLQTLDSMQATDRPQNRVDTMQGPVVRQGRGRSTRRFIGSITSAIAAIIIAVAGIWWVRDNPGIIHPSEPTSQTQAGGTANAFQLNFHVLPNERFSGIPNLGMTFDVEVTNWPLEKLPKRAQVWIFPDTTARTLKRWTIGLQSGDMPSWDDAMGRALTAVHLPAIPNGSMKGFVMQSVTSAKPLDWKFSIPASGVSARNVRLVAMAIQQQSNGGPKILWTKVFTPSDPLVNALQSSLKQQYPGGTVSNLQVHYEKRSPDGLQRYLLFTYHAKSTTGKKTVNGDFFGLLVGEWNGLEWHLSSTATRAVPSTPQPVPLDVLQLGYTDSSGKRHLVVGGRFFDNNIDNAWITFANGPKDVVFLDHGSFISVVQRQGFATKLEGDNSQNKAMFTLDLTPRKS